MKLFLIGGTGNIGSVIRAEALTRNHDVTVLTRDPSKLEAKGKLQVVKGDVHDTAALTRQIAGQDAVVISYNPGWMDPEAEKKTLDAAESVLAAARAAGVRRLFWVGGAASLETAPGVQLFESIKDHVPPTVKGAIVGLREVLYRLRKTDDLDWTFFSPAQEIAEGPRTGVFRLGRDTLIVGPDGKSRISRADYAIAVLDELERPAHVRRRFTSVAFEGAQSLPQSAVFWRA
jgi:putative NADH-flavin reductase